MNEENSKQKKTYKSQAELSFIGVLLEAPNFIAVFLSAVLSQSLVIWIDFIDSFSNITREGFIVFLSNKLQKTLNTNTTTASRELKPSPLCSAISLWYSVFSASASVP